LAAVLFLVPSSTASGVEPLGEFISALRERQWFDEALDYLEQVRTDPVVGPAWKERVLYERGVTIMARAGTLANHEARMSQLAEAGQLFQRFLTDHPEHELAAAANGQLANLMVERGRAAVDRARQSADKSRELGEARQHFEQARGKFQAAEKDLDAQLQKMPKLIPAEQTELAAKKRQLAGELAQTRMMHAAVDYELAKSHEPNSADFKKHLKAATKAYSAIHEAYRTRAAGLWARLWEGRCHQDLGEITQALGCYGDLMDLPLTPETRAVRTKSTRAAMTCWTMDSQKRYDEAIERGTRWERDSGGNETDADALAIRYLMALACQAQSKALPARDPNRKKLAGSARQYVLAVADHPGEYQRPAKMLLVTMRGDKESKDGRDPKATFADMYDAGKQALERMEEAALASRLAEEKGEKASLPALAKQRQENKLVARELLSQAVNLSDSKTNLEDLNSARYYLCFLAWDAGDYYDAAVLGEFLASRYADSPRGKQGAQIALAAYVRLFADPKSTEKEFSAAQIARMADLIFQKWPGQEEADDAALTLVNFAISQGNFEKASEYLQKISANSPRRGLAELRAAQALWSAYVRGVQAPAESRPPQEKLDALKKQAQDLLNQGLSRLEKAETLDPAVVGGVFTLAQILLESGQSDKAIAWLEHEKLGPLTLLKAKSPVANREAFAIETYKLALRAYIAVEPQQLKKAEAAMDALDKLVTSSGDAKAAENLTAVYVSLGHQLEQHLAQLRKAGKTKELAAVSQAFESFLHRVTQRDVSGNYATLTWVADTYFSLASGMDENPALRSERSKDYFQKGAEAYARVLTLVEKDPALKEDQALMFRTRQRLADCYRRGEKYDEAIKAVLPLLRDRPNYTPAQVQAAEIYQARGAVDPKGYFLAITGGEPGRDGRNTIWGWSKLSQMASNSWPQFANTFYEARFNMADARLRYAASEKDTKRARGIREAAKQDLWLTYKLHPDLGGAPTDARYEGLLKEVQKSLGDKEVGLAEFRERDASTTKTSNQ
jgi:hypothetical protein